MNRVLAGYHIGSYPVRRQEAFTKLDFLKTRLIFKLLILGAFMVFLSLIYIWSRVQVVGSGYDINRLKNEQVLLKNQNKRLKMEMSLLQTPGRLEKIAGEKLKMAMPNRHHIIAIQ